MQVRDLMTEHPACCTPDTSLQQCAQMMVDCDCGAIPVVENTESNNPVGIITDRDITTRIIAKGDNPLNMRVADAMTSNTITVSPDDSIEQCRDTMEEHQIRRVLVVDNNNQVVGIVAQADIALHTSEELAGEVVEYVSEPSRQSSQ